MPQPFGCPLRRHSGNFGTNKVFIHFGIYKDIYFAISSTLGPFWIYILFGAPLVKMPPPAVTLSWIPDTLWQVKVEKRDLSEYVEHLWMDIHPRAAVVLRRTNRNQTM